RNAEELCQIRDLRNSWPNYAATAVPPRRSPDRSASGQRRSRRWSGPSVRPPQAHSAAQLPLSRPDRLKPRTRVELTARPRRLRLLCRGSGGFHVFPGVGAEYPGLRRTGTFGMWLFLSPPAGTFGTENLEQCRADDLISPLETVTDDLFRRGVLGQPGLHP